METLRDDLSESQWPDAHDDDPPDEALSLEPAGETQEPAGEEAPELEEEQVVWRKRAPRACTNARSPVRACCCTPRSHDGAW